MSLSEDFSSRVNCSYLFYFCISGMLRRLTRLMGKDACSDKKKTSLNGF